MRRADKMTSNWQSSPARYAVLSTAAWLVIGLALIYGVAWWICGSLIAAAAVPSLLCGRRAVFRFAACYLILGACTLAVALPVRFIPELQGICVDDDWIYWSFTTGLVRTDRDGRALKKIAVDHHHGDLCFHNGELFVAVNHGKFNDPLGNADSWVYVYDAATLEMVTRHEAREVIYGAGGIGFRDGHFFVVGGLPDGFEENYVYEYDDQFYFVQKHTIRSGHTHLGIQTATFAHDHWWFGCHGNPKTLLVTDKEFNVKGRYDFDCARGIVGLPDGRFLAAAGHGRKLQGFARLLSMAAIDERDGLILIGAE